MYCLVGQLLGWLDVQLSVCLMLRTAPLMTCMTAGVFVVVVIIIIMAAGSGGFVAAGSVHQSAGRGCG